MFGLILRVTPDSGVRAVAALAVLPVDRVVVGPVQAHAGDGRVRHPVRAGAGRDYDVGGALEDLVHHLQLFEQHFCKLYNCLKTRKNVQRLGCVN